MRKVAVWRWIGVGVASILLIGIGASGYVLFSKGKVQAPAPIVQQESTPESDDLEQEKALEEVSQRIQSSPIDSQLTTVITNWAKESPGDYGVMLREVTGSQRTASYQAEKPFISASTYKLFVAYGVLFRVQNGSINLNTNVVNGKDIPACLDSLLLYSSDECGWPMGNLIGWPTLSDFLHEQGFTNTDLNNYDANGNFMGDKYSTATDEAEIAWRLNAGTLLEPTYADMMLSRMKTQIWRERIPAGVPEGTVVADKPGWIYDIQNDTAIVYGERSTYVLAIMSDGSTKPHLAELSKLIYDYLNGA